ncbi:MAG TPA: hypothetical protein VIY90_15110 [Steroidobacteraceae bacterium]
MIPLQIRPASVADMPAVTEIYNDVIATSTAVYSSSPSTLAERQSWFDARTAAGFPVIVAVGDSRVLGFASFADFRGL